MWPEPLEVRAPAEPGSVPLLREAARIFARHVGMDEAQVGLVALAVSEAVGNAVVHAFVGRPPGTVELGGSRGDGTILLRVRDDGRGLTPRHDSPGLGLGLPTIARCCRRLDVETGPAGRGTEVRMWFDAPGAGDAARTGVRARLRNVLDAVQEAVTVVDATGRYVYANEQAARLAGAASPEELLAAEPGTLAARFRISLEDGSPVAWEDLPHRRVAAGEQPPPLLTRSVELATGRERWVLTTSRRLDDAEDLLIVNTTLDVTEAKRAELRRRFVTQVSEVLTATTDLTELTRRLADLAVPGLADWCAIDLADGDGVLERVALRHIDPARVALMEEVRRRFPLRPDMTAGPYAVLRSGDPFFVAELPDEVLAQVADEPEHLELMRAIGMRSIAQVPLTGRGRVHGVLTLVTADSGRVLDEQDAALAADVGRRAGVAIDTARRLAG
jgi:PAS domain S-box-containing protein